MSFVLSSFDNVLPETMRAVVASGSGVENVAVRDVPLPRIGPGQMLARVDAAGVCTSILKLLDQGADHPHLNGWDLEKWPLILGDEGAVTLVRVGEGLRGEFAPGQRFAIQPALGVGPILHRERYRNQAREMSKCAVGYSVPGHLAQYIRIQEEILEAGCLLPLPDETLPAFAVSMAEPVSCVLSAQERHYHLERCEPGRPREARVGFLRGGVAVVIGAGAMGRMHVELALRFSPRVLIVAARGRTRLDVVEEKLRTRAEAKGTRLLTVTMDRLAETITDASGGRGADDIILSVGNRGVQQNALEWLAEGGVANLFAGLACGDSILELDNRAVHYREIKVVGSSGGDPGDMLATLRAFSDGEMDPGNYVAAVGSLDNAVDVLRMIREGRIDGKAILYPHIRQTPLRFVDHWDGDEEARFLQEREVEGGSVHA